MNKKTKNTFFFTDIAVPNTHNLAKTITDKQNKYRVTHGSRTVFKKKVLGRFST